MKINELKAKELLENIIPFYSKHHNLSDQITSYIISENKWSLKQIIGHLIDSASNNHQRFIRFQLEEELLFPDYQRDDWLNLVNYNKLDFKYLMELFKHYNYLLSNILNEIDDASLSRKWKINFIEGKNYITFEELIVHYVNHVNEHLNHFEERLEEIKNVNFL